MPALRLRHPFSRAKPSAGLAFFVILSIVVAVLNRTVSQQNTQWRDQNNRIRAEAIAVTSRASLAGNVIDRALLLSLAAVDRKETFETRDALVSSLEASPYLDTILENGSNSGDGVFVSNSFCRDSRTLMVYGEGGIEIRDITTDTERAHLKSNGDSSITLWDTQKRQVLRHLFVGQEIGNVGFPSLGFSPDGSILLASGGADITLWDWANGQEYIRPLHDGADMLSVSFSPDGRFILSADSNGPVTVRYATLTEWKAQACHIAHRNLTADEWKRFIDNDPTQKIPYQTLC